MPTIYRIQCTACGHAPEVESGLAGWVTMDGQQGGKILPEGYLAVKLNTGELKPLPHPVEESALREAGFRWTEAARQGRLFRVIFKICRTCGSLHEERQFHDSRTGCLAAVVLLPVIVVILKFGLMLKWIPTLLGAYVGMLTTAGLVSFFNWLRWRKRNSELKLRDCPRCHSADLATISKAARTALMCPHCHTQNLRCGMAGIS